MESTAEKSSVSQHEGKRSKRDDSSRASGNLQGMSQSKCVVSNDLGSVIKATRSSSEINDQVCKLSDGQKYALLTGLFEPSENYIIPTNFDGGCNRSFKREWLSRYDFLVYSAKLEGGLCKYCTLFVNPDHRKKYGILVNKPFFKWRKMSEQVGGHAKSPSHLEAVAKAKLFIKKVDEPTSTLPHMFDSQISLKMKENRHILRCVAEAVIFCGKQGIAFRGHIETSSENGNPGNFQAYLRSMSKKDPLLKKTWKARAVS